MTLTDRDRAHVWHPYTQMQTAPPPLPIVGGKGVYLFTEDGRRILDGISSWWVNIHGHSHPALNAALAAQAARLEHVMFAGCTHPPAVDLAERLVSLLPRGLTRVFYSDNGSTAVEVAVKLATQYWINKGEPQRQTFVTLHHAYHGDTVGAMSVSGDSIFTRAFAPLLFPVMRAHAPYCYRCPVGLERASCEIDCLGSLEQTLASLGDSAAAVIVEPLVQCAGSMRMYHPVYLKLLREACDRHRVHLIADEIAVGFGRTGTMFACEQASITPDFLCLGKGLTGGYLPLSVCMTTDRIYQAFYAEYAAQRAFLHSHSYTGNPLACAAALATLDIFRGDDVITRNHELAAHMANATLPLHDHPHVSEVRQTGMILAIEMVKNKKTREPFARQERRGQHVARHALERGALLRPLGDVIYLIPPYVITPGEIDFLAEVTREGVEIATRLG